MNTEHVHRDDVPVDINAVIIDNVLNGSDANGSGRRLARETAPGRPHQNKPWLLYRVKVGNGLSGLATWCWSSKPALDRPFGDVALDTQRPELLFRCSQGVSGYGALKSDVSAAIPMLEHGLPDDTPHTLPNVH